MANLDANWHGMPLKYWYVGGAVVTAGGLIMLRRYRAAKALAAGQPATTSSVNLPAGTTGPSSGSDYYGPLGGSSPTGPIIGYGPDGTPIYGVIGDAPKIPGWAKQILDAIKALPTATATPTPSPTVNNSAPATSQPAAPVISAGTPPVIAPLAAAIAAPVAPKLLAPAPVSTLTPVAAVTPAPSDNFVPFNPGVGGYYAGNAEQTKQIIDAGPVSPTSGTVVSPQAAIQMAQAAFAASSRWNQPGYIDNLIATQAQRPFVPAAVSPTTGAYYG